VITARKIQTPETNQRLFKPNGWYSDSGERESGVPGVSATGEKGVVEHTAGDFTVLKVFFDLRLMRLKDDYPLSISSQAFQRVQRQIVGHIKVIVPDEASMGIQSMEQFVNSHNPTPMVHHGLTLTRDARKGEKQCKYI
jgi:hypothetical protein